MSQMAEDGDDEMRRQLADTEFPQKHLSQRLL